MGMEQDNENVTMTKLDNLHQDGHRADKETEDRKDLHGRDGIKTEKGQDSKNEAVTNLGGKGRGRGREGGGD